MNNQDIIVHKNYALLNPFQTKITQVFALSGEPMLLNQVFSMMNRLKIRPDNIALSMQTLEINCLELLNRQVLIPYEKTKFCINPVIENRAVRELYSSNLFENYTRVLNQLFPLETYSYWDTPPLKRYYAYIRIALLRNNTALVNSLIKSGRQKYEDFDTSKIYNILIDPFDERWLLKLSDSLIHSIFENCINELIFDFITKKDLFDFVEHYKLNPQSSYFDRYLSSIMWRYVLEGRFDKLDELRELDTNHSSIQSFNVMTQFVKGNCDLEDLIEKTHQLYREENRKRNTYAPYLSIEIGYLTQLTTDNGYKRLKKYLKAIDGKPTYLTNTLRILVFAQQNNMKAVHNILKTSSDRGIGFVFISYANYWVFREESTLDVERLEAYYNNAKASELTYIQLLISDLLIAYYKLINEADLLAYHQEEFELANKRMTFKSILNLIPSVEPWERAITALEELATQFENNSFGTTVKDKRLIWLISFEDELVEPKEQKLNKNGNWSKGRAVSLERMKEMLKPSFDDFLTSQDKAIIRTISDYYTATVFHLNQEMIAELVGHPLLFLNNDQRTLVEIFSEKPQLIINDVKEFYELKFSIPIEHAGIVLLKETPTRYKAIDVTDEHLKIAHIIGKNTIKFPKDSAEKITKIVKGVSKVINVQSFLLSDDQDVSNVTADPTPHIHLLPIGDGFQFEMYVKPFNSHPPYLKPGAGGSVIISEYDSKRFQTERNLELEEALAKDVIHTCRSLGDSTNIDNIWTFETPEQCLEILTELQPLKEENKVIIEWPKGERLKLRGTASIDNFSIEINGSTDWFEAKGTLKVGEDIVLEMKEVLGLLNQGSRFIKLKDGEFLALTNRFRSQLESLETFGDFTEDGIRFHPLAAYALQDLISETKNKNTDSAFNAQIERLKVAEQIKEALPPTFTATLRNYQQDGFEWLMKLANWGVGACLADDMGLGKTVQALAAILTRSHNGPTLVVCPASVRTNWEREAEKFAPTLNPIQFGIGDRKSILENLKSNDLLITSYGLMQTEAESLALIDFATIVLDEAQAIKNRLAKRSKAAMELKADFKIITTGTPIENHLGELWNLFNFINPGLLGSLDRFRERFALPISRYNDENRQEQLKKLIRPFILRRRKSEVLKELPDKTEIVLSVTMSPEEKAFYEALRRSAVEKLSEEAANQSGFNIKILAEITRLRQACCNPKLVQRNVNIQSSKLELFKETIQELLENGHKVLVFSQFVKHLRILEDSLQKMKVSYQYLDGSTSQKKRQAAIDEFQNGNGDVFLISLKAGGVGLNLTNADYVIHMDPWWNPAVEDQASDRAHRIGQKRPVTIYRLVTEGTIEEKIVQLHAQKRDLADSLLSGTNKGAKMSADELMNLIKEGLRE